jgi:adenine-specific DNA-methyltransferase
MNIMPPKTLVRSSGRLIARDYPQVIKYMGSKARIIDFVVEGLNEAKKGNTICDLFAGACSLSGAVGHMRNIITNDVQTYSMVIAHTYLHPLSEEAMRLTGDKICKMATSTVERKSKYITKNMAYPISTTLSKFNSIDIANRTLIDADFDDDYHLFLKNYSGTWWSAEQCAWIDAFREVADSLLEEGFVNSGDHSIILTCIMHAMAYCGQGTGHYAQYRDAKTEGSMADINIYRQKSMPSYFSKKFEAIKKWNSENVVANKRHILLATDYEDCLSRAPQCTVYADPPYAFVHYSRFYHAIETFVLYDYPRLQSKQGEVVKGRYREDRHQSPFSIRSQVSGAFERMFRGVMNSGSNLVLSYSNSALLDLPTMIELAHDTFSTGYAVEAVTLDHQHMTMGRKADRMRDVEEALLLARRVKAT